MVVSGGEWIERFASAMGVPPPDAEEIDALLALAGTAAHASERTAAPLSTWLAGRAGMPAERAREVAAELARAIEDGDSHEHAGPTGGGGSSTADR